jgi:hypothetical protein
LAAKLGLGGREVEAGVAHASGSKMRAEELVEALPGDALDEVADVGGHQ